ncbi:MAG: hypothetical protein MI746_10675 [Pseudomonadales bacterium]|nr:hypothetical protein [Pseudomonadales bacterium]
MKRNEVNRSEIEAIINYATDLTPTEVDGYVQESRVLGRVVSIRNGRTTETPPSLFKQGFELVNAPKVFDTPPTDEAIRASYPTIEKALLQHTAAKEILIFDHTIRSSIPGTSKRQPIHLAHADYAEQAGKLRLRDLVPEDYKRWEEGRFLIVNLWQSISGVILSSPLAFVDINTVSDDDFEAVKVIYDNRIGQIGYYRFNPRHEWYWYPLLKSSEALLFKTFDSRPGAQHWSCPHTSFQHNASSINAKRSSVEFRILVLLAENESE